MGDWYSKVENISEKEELKLKKNEVKINFYVYVKTGEKTHADQCNKNKNMKFL